MNRHKTFTRTAIAAGLLAACAGAQADADVAGLQQRLAQMEQEMAQLRAELAKVAAQEPAQEQRVQAIESRVAKVESAPAPVAEAPKVAGNRVFFRGGYAKMPDDRSNGAFTDMINVPGAIGLPDINNTSDDGWYFGAGFDFLLSRDTLGLLPGVWTIAELGLEFRDMGGKQAHLIGPVAECLLLNEIKTGGVPGAVNCTNIKGKQNMTMLTVSAAPKLKFMEGSKLRPWIIPAGFDINVISPPSDSTNYLDVGVQFGAGLDYEVFPGITLGADFRYHLAANLTDPDYDSGAVAAAQAAGLVKGLELNTKQKNDVWTAGISLGIAF